MPLAVLFGGSGFIGKYAAQKFARAGWRVRVAVRRPNDALSMRTYGDVGQVEPVQANIRDDASVARAVQGADVVVNLVGILNESGKQRFDAVQAEGARRVAAAAKAAGASRFVQVSAIGADPDGAAAYARTKAAGEAAARAAFPDAVILRPSIVFGPEDQFFNRFAGMARLSPAIPLVGGQTRFQPVYVDDVAGAIFKAATLPEAAGNTYELGGPQTHSFADLMRLMLTTIHRRRFLAPLPFAVASFQAWGLDLAQTLSFGLFTNTLLTQDQVKMLRRDNVVSEGALGLQDLGVEATTLESVLPSYLYRFRPYGQYDRSVTMA